MSLYDDYKARMGAGNTSALQSSLEKDLADAKVDASLTTARLSKADQASNARSAFAAGKASSQKKVFKGKGAGAYGAIGKLDDANLKAAAKSQKDVVDLDQLSNRSNVARNAGNAANLASIRQNFNSNPLLPIRIW